jgi:DNA-binding PadR family transcriptional regulator
MEHHDLLAGFIRLHVLHHAAQHEIYGLWMIEELASHGYRLSPGTLYPMLHGMEKQGYLTSREERTGRTTRKLYRATAFGIEGLSLAKHRIQEFVREAVHHSPTKVAVDEQNFNG